MKQPLLSEKLKKYSAVAGAMTVAATAADAQILYTDVNPDVVVQDTVTYTLDFNSDGIPELNFGIIDTVLGSLGQVKIAGAQLLPPTNNALIGSIYNSYAFPFALNAGDSVQTPGAWTAQYVGNGLNALSAYVANLGTFGNWAGAVDRYLGARFEVNSQLYYGWVRLNVSQTSDTIVIKDYAYNVNAGLPIIAGQLVGIDEHQAKSDVRVHAYDQTVFVHTTEAGAQITVLNTLGETVFASSTNDSDSRFNLEQLATGVYFVRVEQAGRVETRKVYLR